MIEAIDQSTGNVIGFRLSGTITKADYAVLDPAVDAVVKEYGSVDLLLDLSDFHWEKASAWASDVDFGRTYKDKIDKMAMVSEARWAKHLAKLAEPFYAKEIKTFVAVADAWDWLKG
jgi:hypothetical protein